MPMVASFILSLNLKRKECCTVLIDCLTVPEKVNNRLLLKVLLFVRYFVVAFRE